MNCTCKERSSSEGHGGYKESGSADKQVGSTILHDLKRVVVVLVVVGDLVLESAHTTGIVVRLALLVWLGHIFDLVAAARGAEIITGDLAEGLVPIVFPVP